MIVLDFLDSATFDLGLKFYQREKWLNISLRIDFSELSPTKHNRMRSIFSNFYSSSHMSPQSSATLSNRSSFFITSLYLFISLTTTNINIAITTRHTTHSCPHFTPDQSCLTCCTPSSGTDTPLRPNSTSSSTCGTYRLPSRVKYVPQPRSKVHASVAIPQKVRLEYLPA